MRLGLPLRIDQRGVPVPGGRGQKSGLHSTRNVTEKCLFECWGFLQIFHDTWECSYLVPRSRIQGLIQAKAASTETLD